MAETTSPVIKLKDVRLSFPAILEAKEYKKGDGKFRYGATYILDPKIKDHKAMIDDIETEAEELFQANKGSLKGAKTLEDLDALCFGYAKDHKKFKKRPEYEGMFYLKVGSPADKPPAVVDRQKKRLSKDSISKQKPYSGCYVNATTTLWIQNNEYGQKMNANALIVQFNKAGESFSGAEIDLDELDTVDDIDDDLNDDDDSIFDDDFDDDIPF
jgi:hypothetical protein